MEIVWNLNNSTLNQPSILTIGTFDGIHLGHQAIINRLNDHAKLSGGISTLITFEPHPQLIIPRSDKPEIRLLTTIEEKINLLQKSGLGRLVIAGFTPEFALTEPAFFVEKVLVERMAMKHIVIGHDHAFGKGRAGNINLLHSFAKTHHFDVEVVEPVEVDGRIVSSTLIRKSLLKGDAATAIKLLGRPYIIRGQVIEGDGRGRKLGFPTANIRTPSRYKLIPCNGVYATKCVLEGKTYDSIVSIGVRPTFNSNSQCIEAHLIDFDGDLYGKEIEIRLTHRIRNEERFDTAQELVEQMKMDKNKSLELLEHF